MLYERDYYLGLTETEEQQYEEITGRKFWEKRVSGFGRVNNFMAYPKAARMCKSLFPNNYLDVAELRDVERLEYANEEFLSLLDNTECTERSILNFIREKEYYNIIGSIIWGLSINIGNHGAYLFPEFQLGSSYKADYLLLGKSSGGFEFIFVELESPYGNITLKDGQLGAEFRDGISQLEDWKRYLDDGLYTGSRLRKDIKRCIEMIPEGSRIDVIYMIACQSGLDFSKRILEELCKTKNIKINILRWREICNNKKIKRHDNGVSYEPIQDCLWPSSKLSKLPEISAYVEKLEEIKGKKVYYCFRNAGYKYTAGIFSNLVNRDIVEEEFLKKGIAITQNIQEHKGLYPLGYNLTPSLGFGSFCATDLNISNTCPIVLWWGNVIEKGNELDCWYPLLPRRISAKDINPFDADWTLQEAEDDGYDDVFDTCPDCGCGISLRNDGGNGFCIDCAWNH